MTITFGSILREMRTQRGWSQVALAAATNGAVSPSMVALIEVGKRAPGHDTVDALADALGVTARVRAELHAARKADRAAPPAPPAAPAGPTKLDMVSLHGLTPEQRLRVLGYIDALRHERDAIP